MRPPRLRAVAGCGVAAAVLAWAAWNAGAIVHSGWWRGLADLPAGFYLLAVPVAAVALIGQTVSDSMPRWGQRLAALPVLAWAAMLVLAVGALVHDVAGVPVGVLVLGVVLVPVLAGLAGVWPAALLGLCSAAALLRLAVGLALPLATVYDVLFAFAGVLAGVVVWARLFFARPAPAPLARIGEERRTERAESPADDAR